MSARARLFNRLARKRISIVHDQPGITRDVISAQVAEGNYTLLDTGGLGLTGQESTAELITASENQVGFAIDAATVILFVLDGWAAFTGLDERIASRLRRSGKSILLVVNKADFGDDKIDVGEAYRLGFGRADPGLRRARAGGGGIARGDSGAARARRSGPRGGNGREDAADPLCFASSAAPT